MYLGRLIDEGMASQNTLGNVRRKINILDTISEALASIQPSCKSCAGTGTLNGPCGNDDCPWCSKPPEQGKVEAIEGLDEAIKKTMWMHEATYTEPEYMLVHKAARKYSGLLAGKGKPE